MEQIMSKDKEIIEIDSIEDGEEDIDLKKMEPEE